VPSLSLHCFPFHIRRMMPRKKTASIAANIPHATPHVVLSANGT
jgi:hypothetical protein